MTLYAATSNAGKLSEFAACASSAGIDVLALPGIKSMPEPVEDADTFMGNAELKAVAYSLLSPGLLVFADDSGLAVDALDGQPGVRSARLADDCGFEPGCGSKDERNNRCLLALLANHTHRAAHFICTLALACNGIVQLRAKGILDGQVLDTPRGEDGFGYDPLFLVPTLGLTLADVSREQKWQIGHRGNAFRALLSQLHRQML